MNSTHTNTDDARHDNIDVALDAQKDSVSDSLVANENTAVVA